MLQEPRLHYGIYCTGLRGIKYTKAVHSTSRANHFALMRQLVNEASVALINIIAHLPMTAGSLLYPGPSSYLDLHQVFA